MALISWILAGPSSSKIRWTTASASASHTRSGGTVSRSPPATDRRVFQAHAGSPVTAVTAPAMPSAPPVFNRLRLVTCCTADSPSVDRYR